MVVRISQRGCTRKKKQHECFEPFIKSKNPIIQEWLGSFPLPLATGVALEDDPHIAAGPDLAALACRSILGG